MFIIDFARHLLDAFAHAANDVLGGLLAFVGVGLVLGIGWFIAIMAARGVRWVGATLAIDTTGTLRIAQRFDIALDPLEMLAQAVLWLILLIFFVTACYALQIPFITATVHACIKWLPSFWVALVVMGGATIVAYGARQAVIRMGGRDKAWLGNLASAVIAGVALFVALAVVAVPPSFLAITFGAVMLALSLGGGLALGLGGSDLIKHALDRWLARDPAHPVERARDSLQSLTDPARTIVPLQNELSSYSLRERH